MRVFVLVLAVALVNALFVVWLIQRRNLQLTRDLRRALAERDLARADEKEARAELAVSHRESSGHLTAVADAVAEPSTTSVVNGRYTEQRVIHRSVPVIADVDGQLVSEEDWVRFGGLLDEWRREQGGDR